MLLMLIDAITLYAATLRRMMLCYAIIFHAASLYYDADSASMR